MADTAKIFWSGRSQAVRLPKAYRFAGDEVTIRYETGRVILEGVPATPEEALALDVARSIEQLRALIDEGMEGEDEPWDAEAIKRDARATWASKQR